MRRSARRRSANTRWLVAAVVLLLIAAGLAAYLFWPGGIPPGPMEPVASVTTVLDPGPAPTTAAPASTVPASTTTSLAPTTTASPATTTSTEPPPTPPLAFEVDLAMSHIEALAAGIGVRRSGTAAEDAAAEYAADYLERLGYAITVTDVPLPDGRVSHNVRAHKEGASGSVIVVGAHLDSKVPSPGANDNASGVGLVLELARDLRDADIAVSLEFVLFGAEEIVDSNHDHHHFGSRRYVQEMTADERAALVGMISPDLVAYGDELLVRNMGRGPRLLTDMLIEYSCGRDLPARFALDPGSSGWSDHEPFELAGYPVAWLEWQDDPAYHTEGDSYEHVDPIPLQQTGEMLLSWLGGLTETDLAALAGARDLEP